MAPTTRRLAKDPRLRNPTHNARLAILPEDSTTSDSQRMSAGWILVALSVLYLILVWVGTHLPASAIPKVSHIDKFIHALAYFGLAALATSSLVSFFRPTAFMVVSLLFGLLFLAMCDEISQIPVPGRNGDFFDFVADSVGIVAGIGGVLMAFAIWRYGRKHS